jgi:hypothetical protein
MMDIQEATIETLNQLYAAEQRSLLPRLAEMGVFVEWADARQMEAVRRMINDGMRHQLWLTEAIDAAGGAVYPSSADPASAGLHYTDLRVLLPKVVENVRGLIDVYELALQSDRPLTSEAATAVTRILNSHRAHLAELEKILEAYQVVP